jgi:transcriptional regulator with XRE-family HTH domain|nr:MAG TPA: Repressor protein CI [Caudoviricetes sp.]
MEIHNRIKQRKKENGLIINKDVFSLRLSALLSSSDETTYSVARKLGMSAATISRYANDIMLPKLPTVYSLANIFRVNPLWLMGYDVPQSEIDTANSLTEQEKALLAFYRSAGEENKLKIIQYIMNNTRG